LGAACAQRLETHTTGERRNTRLLAESGRRRGIFIVLGVKFSMVEKKITSCGVEDPGGYRQKNSQIRKRFIIA
jgi:hypothetical protein